SAGDEPPREAPGAILALADRFDTLAGLFQIGFAPTGSKDPYGLRRAAFGAVSIVTAQGWRLDWRPVLERALSLYPPGIAAIGAPRALSELETFFAERLRNLLERRGYREALAMIASIAPSLDRFFVEVLVNCPEEDLRRNRLALLASIQKEFSRVADFSEIVVEKEK